MSPIPNTESERNYAAFMGQLPDLIADHSGKFALLHSQRVVDYFETAADAVVDGLKRFGRERYSVQEVTNHIENLGFYSYAGGPLQA